MWSEVDSRIRRALNGVRLAFRGKGSSTTTTGPVQTMQGEGLSKEPIQGNELFQHFGFTSRPPAGYQFIALPVGGKTSHAVIIATEHGQYRLKTLESGETALYDMFGTSVILKKGKICQINCDTLEINASSQVVMNTPQVQMNSSKVATTGEMIVDEDITDRNAHPDRGTQRGMRELYDTHTHKENDMLGQTEVPTQRTGSD